MTVDVARVEALERENAALHDEVHGLRSALDSTTVISQATGILMERYGIDTNRAFTVLVRQARTSGLRLLHVAEDIVASSRSDG